MIDAARRAGADVTGADPDEIVLGPNATTLLMGLSRSFGRTLGPGDEVVVTMLDHDANVRPWILAAEDAGATVRWVDIHDDDVTLDLDSFDRALSDRTRLVAFTLASNAVGTIPHAAELARRAHAAGALVAVDGVHLAQHRALDVRAIGADILACSPYKFFGPHLGMLAVRRELLQAWRPYKLRPAPDEVPAQLGDRHPEPRGARGARRGGRLPRRASGGTSARPSAGTAPRARSSARLRRDPAPTSASCPSASWQGWRACRGSACGASTTPRAWSSAPRRSRSASATSTRRRPPRSSGGAAILVWDGHYYAITVMERLGLLDGGGAVRVGFCHYHSAQDVDRVLTELDAL